MISGISPANDDGPQALRGLVIEGLGSEPTWFERAPQPIVDRLATVVRIGSDACLQVGEVSWRIDPPGPSDVAPIPDESEEWD